MFLFNSIASLGDCGFSPISLQSAQVKEFYDVATAFKELLFFSSGDSNFFKDP